MYLGYSCSHVQVTSPLPSSQFLLPNDCFYSRHLSETIDIMFLSIQSQKEKLNELVQEIRTEAEERERQLTSRHQEEQSTLKQELYTLSIKVCLAVAAYCTGTTWGPCTVVSVVASKTLCFHSTCVIIECTAT